MTHGFHAWPEFPVACQKTRSNVDPVRVQRGVVAHVATHVYVRCEALYSPVAVTRMVHLEARRVAFERAYEDDVARAGLSPTEACALGCGSVHTAIQGLFCLYG